MTEIDDRAMLERLEQLALAAGAEIMAVFAAGYAVEQKDDLSPVTEADRRAETVILQGLRESFPEIPCVAEEEASAGLVPPALGDQFFLIDPLDGTKEFIKRRPDFTVNIALVRHGVPELGVVYAPAQGMLYSGRPGKAFAVTVSPEHVAGTRSEISVRGCASPKTIVASRSHRTPETDAFLEEHDGAEIVSVGSSLKFCLLASGQADLYPRFGRTMEWDTAAGDAVLRAAGGSTRRVDGGPFVYGKRNQGHDADFANPWFVAEGGAAR
ncbi:MAG: 3'(2'),5'-bisphosphate nucleotidase CysQ [Mesorhizobium sp.]|nr:3'(2'),5'-bisphosphate nucleotidase CysQ [Mesorhizobium sp.]